MRGRLTGRRGILAAVAAAAVLLGACKGEPEPTAQETAIPEAIARNPAKAAAAPAGQPVIGTPMNERVATLGLLNKRNNLTQDVVMKPGQTRRVGNVVLKLAACEKTPPWERPAEEGAFVQVFVEDRATPQEALAWHKIFSGWLFRHSPALNVVQHPVYDVWLKKCEMSFPGEEDSPASSASASSAAKASGSASESPAPAASASPASAPAAPAAPAPAAAPAADDGADEAPA